MPPMPSDLLCLDVLRQVPCLLHVLQGSSSTQCHIGASTCRRIARQQGGHGYQPMVSVFLGPLKDCRCSAESNFRLIYVDFLEDHGRSEKHQCNFHAAEEVDALNVNAVGMPFNFQNQKNIFVSMNMMNHQRTHGAHGVSLCPFRAFQAVQVAVWQNCRELTRPEPSF